MIRIYEIQQGIINNARETEEVRSFTHQIYSFCPSKSSYLLGVFTTIPILNSLMEFYSY